MKNTFYLSILLIFSLLYSCGSNVADSKINETEKEDSPKDIVIKWNKAINEQNEEMFWDLYDSVVYYYHTNYGNVKCTQVKMESLNKTPDFKQKISDSIKVIFSENGAEATCNFIKTVSIGETEKDYEAYLILSKKNGKWKINTESDVATDLYYSKKHKEPEETVEGDFNGDGIKEKMWLEEPKFPANKEETMECDGKCECYIYFSNPLIQPIKVDMCIGGIPVNEGDLNGDGTDEIGLLPDWWTSCWKAYFVYTYRAKTWSNLIPSVSTHCNQWENGSDVIKKHSSKKGFVIVTYSELTDADIETKTKDVFIGY